jgi:hypothetical protein
MACAGSQRNGPVFKTRLSRSFEDGAPVRAAAFKILARLAAFEAFVDVALKSAAENEEKIRQADGERPGDDGLWIHGVFRGWVLVDLEQLHLPGIIDLAFDLPRYLALRAACGWLSSLRSGSSVIVLLMEHFTLSLAGAPFCTQTRRPMANLLLSADG